MTIFRKSLVALALISSLPVFAEQAEYFDYTPSMNVMSCDTKMEIPTLGLRRSDGSLPTRTVYDCRPSGKKTPTQKQMPFINRETGERFVRRTAGTLTMQCGEHGCVLQNEVDGYTPGALLGQGRPGNYLIENGWYLDYDAEGNTVAYRNDVGPKKNQAPFGSSKPRPKNYGKDACYEDAMDELERKFGVPNQDYYLERQILEECGLPSQ